MANGKWASDALGRPRSTEIELTYRSVLGLDLGQTYSYSFILCACMAVLIHILLLNVNIAKWNNANQQNVKVHESESTRNKEKSFHKSSLKSKVTYNASSKFWLRFGLWRLMCLCTDAFMGQKLTSDVFHGWS